MAEPTNFPGGSSPGARQASQVVGPTAITTTPAPAPAGPDEFESYKPVSILSIGGFVVSCFWAVLVCLIGTFVLVFGPSLPLTGPEATKTFWGLLLALLGCALTLWAALQIARSQRPNAEASASGILMALPILGALITGIWALLVVISLVRALSPGADLRLPTWFLLVPLIGSLLIAIAAAQAKRSASAPADAESPRSFSSLAILAFLLLGLSVVILVVSRVPALFSEEPVLLPLAWTLVPLLGIALSFVALVQIQRSEGTRGGLLLARWGLGLSLVFGLCYWSYYAAIYWAVHLQTKAFVQQWFNQLRDGNTDAAFCYTVEPARRPDPNRADLRQYLEGRFGQAEGQESTPTLFARSSIPRLVMQGGKDTVITSQGMQLDRDKGYVVKQNYRITTPDGSCDVKLAVRGREGRWYLNLGESEIAVKGNDNSPTAGIEHTPRGKRNMQARVETAVFVREWSEKLSIRHLEEIPVEFMWDALRDTRDPAQREQLPPSHATVAAFATVYGSVALYNPKLTLWLHLPKLTLWLHLRDLIRIDPSTLSAPEDIRPKARAEILKLFGPGREVNPGGLRVQAHLSSLCKTEGNRFRVQHDFQMPLAGNSSLAEGTLVVETDAAAWEAGKPAVWRLTNIQVLRIRPYNPNTPGGGGPPQR